MSFNGGSLSDRNEKFIAMMKHWRTWLLCVLILALGGVVYSFFTRQENTSTYEGTELTGESPDFQLTDQNGAVIKLSDFRGKVVVLTFMDTQCVDTCPLTASHFRRAYQQLNADEAEHVVFLGVNVNVEVNDVADILQITQNWRLDEIPTWHFLTGSPSKLEKVWRDYGVAVQSSHDSSDERLLHTPGTYILDPSGQKCWYISIPISANNSAEFDAPLSDLLTNHIRAILREAGC